eukprot:gene21182-25444_t
MGNGTVNVESNYVNLCYGDYTDVGEWVDYDFEPSHGYNSSDNGSHFDPNRPTGEHFYEARDGRATGARYARQEARYARDRSATGARLECDWSDWHDWRDELNPGLPPSKIFDFNR